MNDPSIIGPVGALFSEARITAVKTAVDLNGGDLMAGDEIEYRVTILNLRPDMVENLHFTDSVPIHTTLVAGSLAGTIGVTAEGPLLKVSAGDLAVGGASTSGFG